MNAEPRGNSVLLPRLAAAVLCLTVAWIHVKDQGGFPGSKDPTYVGIGYYMLEAAGLLCALLLLVPRLPRPELLWTAVSGVAIGPLLGFVLSRGPGLPDYTDDKGNWTETLGLEALAVEGALLLLSAAVLVSLLRRPAARAVDAPAASPAAERHTDSVR